MYAYLYVYYVCMNVCTLSLSMYVCTILFYIHIPVNLVLHVSRWCMQSSWLYCVRVRHTLLCRQAAKYVCMYVYVCKYVYMYQFSLFLCIHAFIHNIHTYISSTLMGLLSKLYTYIHTYIHLFKYSSMSIFVYIYLPRFRLIYCLRNVILSAQ